MRREGAIVLLTSAVLVVVSFWSSYGLFRFHDDWTFVYKAATAVNTHQVASFVFHPLDQHWSPGWHTLEVVNFIVAGWNADWFIRTLIAACTLLSLLLCASLLRTFGVSTPGRVVAVATLALHHASAAARFSFDTYSQSLSDLLGWTAVVVVIRALLSASGITLSTIARTLALLTPALLFKEQSLSAFLAIGLTTIAAATWRPELRRSRRAALLLTFLTVETAAFAALRAAMGVRFRPAGEAFSLCVTCVPVNVAELGAAVLMPLRTLIWFDAVRRAPADTMRVIAVLVASAAVGAAVVVGNIGRARPSQAETRALTLVVCAIAASYFPVSLLGHVGELHTHTSLFWFAVLVGLGTDALWRRARVVRAMVGTFAVIYLASLGIGQRANLRDMRATGERARQWLARIADRLQPVPDGGFVVIGARGPYKGPFDYGLYRLTTPQLLVLTGISPYPVRATTHDRVTVFLEDVDPDAWRDRLMAAMARGAAFRLDIADEDARLSPWLGAAETSRR